MAFLKTNARRRAKLVILYEPNRKRDKKNCENILLSLRSIAICCLSKGCSDFAWTVSLVITLWKVVIVKSLRNPMRTCVQRFV